MTIYSELHKYLKFDFELNDDEPMVKKHKDFTRIVEISSKNNRVFSYEFSSLLAKFLDKIGINFEYNDKFIIARIGIYIVKFKSITEEFNSGVLTETEILNGVVLQNSNKNTNAKFEKIYKKVYKRIYKDKIDLKILKMPFKYSLDLYKTVSKKTSLEFTEKYKIFLSLIEKVQYEDNAIGYVYEIKNVLFNASELDANISFATISEEINGELEPIVIITINDININLYNSNKYIYYNPPYELKILNLKEIRQFFFNGYFKYIKGTKDNIIGVEKI